MGIHHLVAMLAGTLSAAATPLAPPFVHLPIELIYGDQPAVTTTLQLPGQAGQNISVVYDLGSVNWWVVGENATLNWGCTEGLACEGPCNAPIEPVYDYVDSKTATGFANYTAFYSYGNFGKEVEGQHTVNDTFTFTNAAGQASTICDMRVELASNMILAVAPGGPNDTCLYNNDFNHAIMGLAPWVPYYANPNSTSLSPGPSARRDLLERGVIRSPLQCMWFDEAPEDVFDTYTGGGMFGAIDTSKYTGPLVKVPVKTKNVGSNNQEVGYWVAAPKVSISGKAMNGSDYDGTACMIDSGSQVDDIPVNFDLSDEFNAALNMVTTPLGYYAYNGTCDSIPRNLTIDLTWAGVEDGEEVTIKVPLRNYVRGDATFEEGYCFLNVDNAGCMFTAPFMTAAFFAADDARNEIALAQGGVSKRGSAPDLLSLVDSL